MIDIKIVRENAEMIQKNCQRRGYPIDIEGLIKLDADCRALGMEIENMRSERNRLSKECAANPEARERVKQIKVQLGEKESKFDDLQERIRQVLIRMPNLLSDDVPDGTDDTGNVELRKVGVIPTFDFPIKDHQELGEALDILDIARGSTVAQTGFSYWKGQGAMLAQAFFFWVQKFLVERGFTMFMTPCAA